MGRPQVTSDGWPAYPETDQSAKLLVKQADRTLTAAAERAGLDVSSWLRALGMREAEGKLSGEVEADETFIGGLARNMHASKRAARLSGKKLAG